jgi:uncharacterized protein
VRAQGPSALLRMTIDLEIMPRKRTIKLRCPICKKPTKTTDSDFPFCSDRCRLIDLGKWASGAYVISSPVADADEAVRQDSLPDNFGDEDGD